MKPDAPVRRIRSVEVKADTWSRSGRTSSVSDLHGLNHHDTISADSAHADVRPPAAFILSRGAL